MKLVEQRRTVTRKLRILVGIIKNRILTERLDLLPYINLFGYDPLNRMLECYKSVPAYKENQLSKTRSLNQGADHARIHYFTLNRQSLQRKCVLNRVLNIRFFSSLLKKRYYSCNAYNNSIKGDVDTNNVSGQNVRDKYTADLGDLKSLKKEIRCQDKKLAPLLVNCINKGIWPMLCYNKDIRSLVKNRQKYLSLLSNQYGLRSTVVMQQVDEWLCKVDLRVMAIESIYRSSGNLTPGVDGLKLQRENLIGYLDVLKYNNLKKFYKTDPIRRVFIPKGNKNEVRLLGIPTIKDRIVQTLFVQVLEPIIDVHADYYSFGYRKGRNPHQAIGVLSKMLMHKPKHQRNSNKRYFVHSKFVINIDVKQFFDKVSHKWLLENYPFPTNFVSILNGWLSSEVIFQGEYETSFTGFPQGSVIGPSLANFTLNGLEKIIIPNQKTAFDPEKFNYYLKQGFKYNKSSSFVRKTLSSSVVRYVDDFIVVVNDELQAKIIKSNIKRFLAERELEINLSKSKIVKWKNNAKFDYLGFTFHYILKKKITKVTVQRRFNKNFVRGGLYVYPSKIKVQMFKKKIKTIINKNLNVSPFRLIKILNPILTGWANYFGVGTLRVFSRLDHFIYYRLWRYLRRKYKKVPIGKLVERFFQGIETPSGRTWQFHGTHNNVNKDTLKRKGSVAWLVLLCNVNKPIPAHMFNPNNDLIESTYFIDETVFNNYNINIVNLRGGKNVKNFDKWSMLYTKQKGLCTICGIGLGYLISENLEIDHIKRIADLDIGDPLLKDIDNLRLIHKSCHKTTLKLKKK